MNGAARPTGRTSGYRNPVAVPLFLAEHLAEGVMPLVDTGYTLKEACNLISQKLPHEDSPSNLVEALHMGPLIATITCELTGNTYRLPSAVWKSSDARFDFDIEASCGSIQEKLVRRPAPSYTAKPRGHFDRDGHFHPNYLTGEVRIERESFDALLEKMAQPSSQPEAKTPSPRRFSGAILQAWYKGYIDNCKTAGKIPSREDDWVAARDALGDGVPRDDVREARRQLAPGDWKAHGRRKTGEK